MPTPFPGMDPYLEHPALWHDVHLGMIASIRDTLAPLLRPRYRVLVEERTYRVRTQDVELAGIPDVLAVRINETTVAYQVPGQAQTVQVPTSKTIKERYLVVSAVQSGEVVTVIELLSPTNKRSGKGRRQYVAKRAAILDSMTHLVEIDLLRAYEPMLVYGNGHHSHYRILVSRSNLRPQADLYGFDVQERIPRFLLPLRPGDKEPFVDVGQLLHDLYDRAGYDLSIDYRRDPAPPFEGEDAAWVEELLAPLRK
jgi:hypothetical protein